MKGFILVAGEGLGLTGGTGGGVGFTALFCVLFRAGKGLDGGRGFIGSVSDETDDEDGFSGGCGAGLQGVTRPIRGVQACFAVVSMKVG